MKLAEGKYLIGVGGWIPWLSSDDRKLFRQITEDKVCFVTGSTFRAMTRPGNDKRKFVVATKSKPVSYENPNPADVRNVHRRANLHDLIKPDGTPTEWWDIHPEYRDGGILVIGGPLLYERTAPASIILSEIKAPWKVSECHQKMHYYVVPAFYKPRSVILETEQVLCREFSKEGVLSC